MAANAWLHNPVDDLWDVRCRHDDGEFVGRFESEDRAKMFHDDYKFAGPLTLAAGMAFWKRWMVDHPADIAELATYTSTML